MVLCIVRKQSLTLFLKFSISVLEVKSIDCSCLSTRTLTAITEGSPQQTCLKQNLFFFLLIFPNILNFNDQKPQPAKIDMHSSERQFLAPMKISVLFYKQRKNKTVLDISGSKDKLLLTVHCGNVTLEITAVYSCSV